MRKEEQVGENTQLFFDDSEEREKVFEQEIIEHQNRDSSQAAIIQAVLIAGCGILALISLYENKGDTQKDDTSERSLSRNALTIAIIIDCFLASGLLAWIRFKFNQILNQKWQNLLHLVYVIFSEIILMEVSISKDQILTPILLVTLMLSCESSIWQTEVKSAIACFILSYITFRILISKEVNFEYYKMYFSANFCLIVLFIAFKYKIFYKQSKPILFLKNLVNNLKMQNNQIKHFYSHVLESIPHGIAIVNEKLLVKHSNSNLQLMLHCDKAQDIIEKLNQLEWNEPSHDLKQNSPLIKISKKETSKKTENKLALSNQIGKNNLQCNEEIDDDEINIQHIDQRNFVKTLQKLFTSPTKNKINQKGALNDGIIDNAINVSSKSSDNTKVSHLSSNQGNCNKKFKAINTMIQTNMEQQVQSWEIEANSIEGKQLHIKLMHYELGGDEVQLSSEQASPYDEGKSAHTRSKGNLEAYKTIGKTNALNDKSLVFLIVEDQSQAQMVKKLENQNEYKMRMLASVSHELRTPLNCSISMLQIMRETLILQNQKQMIKENLDPALYSSKLLLNLINDILDFAQLEAGKFKITCQTFNLKQLLQECLVLISIQSKMKNLQLKLQMGDHQHEEYNSSSQIEVAINPSHNDNSPKLFINSDPNRVRQVVLNLLSNALKFTNSGGIFLQTKIVSFKPLAIKIVCSDTGIGIPSDRCTTIFDNFNKADLQNRIKYNQCGAGLGLSISNQLAKMLCPAEFRDSPITVVSEVGKGSSFSFVIRDQSQDNLIELQHDNTQRLQADEIKEELEKKKEIQIAQIENENIYYQVGSQKNIKYKASQFRKKNSPKNDLKNSQCLNNSSQIDISGIVCKDNLDSSEVDFISSTLRNRQNSPDHQSFNNNIDMRIENLKPSQSIRDIDSNRIDPYNIVNSPLLQKLDPVMCLKVAKLELQEKKEAENNEQYSNNNFNVTQYKQDRRASLSLRLGSLNTLSAVNPPVLNLYKDIMSKQNSQDLNQNNYMYSYSLSSSKPNQQSASIKTSSRIPSVQISSGDNQNAAEETHDKVIQNMEEDEEVNENSYFKNAQKKFTTPSKSENFPNSYHKWICNSLEEFKNNQQQMTCGHSQVLVVDDNQFNIIALQQQVSKFNLKVDMAFGGESALNMIKKRILSKNDCCPFYLMVFMDIDMPVMNGYEATILIQQFLREQNLSQYDCPVVACSAYVSPEDRQAAFDSGMLDYIVKPIMLGTLDKVFTHWFVKSHSMSVPDIQ